MSALQLGLALAPRWLPRGSDEMADGKGAPRVPLSLLWCERPRQTPLSEGRPVLTVPVSCGQQGTENVLKHLRHSRPNFCFPQGKHRRPERSGDSLKATQQGRVETDLEFFPLGLVIPRSPSPKAD